MPMKLSRPVVYLASGITVAVPITIAATNSFKASSLGEGGPPFLLVVLGGIGLASGLATLMKRHVYLGIAISAALAVALLGVGLVRTY
jgi:phosphotransferase system  glucose/maltose/N-acetylglucosamine-specific IIC component